MSAEGPSPPAARRGRPDRLEPARNKTALALLYDEGSENAYDVRLRLTKEALTVQQQDVVCLGGAHPGANHRTVTLRRQPVGGLGLSIKGGAEHCVPVVISKIFKDRAADRSGMLFIGDAVLQVNGIHVEHATHEEVVHLLRNAGDEVTITVEYLREAPSFLKLPLGSPGPSSSHSSRTSSPLFDSGLHLNGHCSHTAPSLPSSPTADEPKYEKRWLDTLSIPLSMARISRYKAGTGSLRSHAFEVLALDGARSGVLQFSTAQDCGDWLHAISANISHLMLQSMKMANKCCSPGNQVVHMGWVNERLQGADSSQALGSKFLALKGSSVYIFSSPPVSTADWLRAENVYNLCEVLFKVHKSKTYMCSWQGEVLCFTVDFALGFTCFDSKTKNVLWRFKFSQLKGSSDDGNTRVKLLFQNPDTKQIEMKELEFQDLPAVLHCVHAFMASKVASLDPTFLDSHSLAGRYLHSS
ncbi:PREDICTED: gamma-2-syntrophin isoform X4 [Chinchilla lanigera]|uniref:gamma-2-syntrophin isoform X4 n=1 Tax=Chinchilla lanigera TaxID=34839 RepID=UPI0006965F6D|nr:PREDICTED: gamma-2-syntrophin isoform X4 [Chinchilla lanigera]